MTTPAPPRYAVQMGEVTHLMRQQTSVGRPLSKAERASERAQWLRMIVNSWEAASGRPLGETPEASDTRFQFLLTALDNADYSSDQAAVAADWILRGRPCRYGQLTYADFWPGKEQLEELGIDLGAGIDRVRQAAFERGRQAGVALTEEERAHRESRLKAVALAADKLRTTEARLVAAFVQGCDRMSYHLRCENLTDDERMTAHRWAGRLLGDDSLGATK